MAEKTSEDKAKAAKLAAAAKKAGLEKQQAAKAAGPAFETNADGRETEHAFPRLKAQYKEAVVPALMEKHGLKNPHQVPRLNKIVVNIGVSEARDNVQMLDNAREELALIAGQWPQPTRENIRAPDCHHPRDPRDIQRRRRVTEQPSERVPDEQELLPPTLSGAPLRSPAGNIFFIYSWSAYGFVRPTSRLRPCPRIFEIPHRTPHRRGDSRTIATADARRTDSARSHQSASPSRASMAAYLDGLKGARRLRTKASGTSPRASTTSLKKAPAPPRSTVDRSFDDLATEDGHAALLSRRPPELNPQAKTCAQRSRPSRSARRQMHRRVATRAFRDMTS